MATPHILRLTSSRSHILKPVQNTVMESSNRQRYSFTSFEVTQMESMELRNLNTSDHPSSISNNHGTPQHQRSDQAVDDCRSHSAALSILLSAGPGLLRWLKRAPVFILAGLQSHERRQSSVPVTGILRCLRLIVVISWFMVSTLKGYQPAISVTVCTVRYVFKTNRKSVIAPLLTSKKSKFVWCALQMIDNFDGAPPEITYFPHILFEVILTIAPIFSSFYSAIVPEYDRLYWGTNMTIIPILWLLIL